MKEWEFTSFSIEHKKYGELKGTMLGKIAFEVGNGIDDKFMLSLSEEDTKEIFNIISKKIPNMLNNIGEEFNQETI